MKNRIEYLDGLRGIMAVLVILCHLALAFDFYAVTQKENSLIYNFFYSFPMILIMKGKIQVYTFFILSGFVLSYSYLKNPNLDKLQLQFFKRYFRLALPVFIVSFISYLFILLGLNFTYLVKFSNQHLDLYWLEKTIYSKSDSISLFFLFKDSFYSSFIKGDSFLINQVIWTMQVELIGSFGIYFFLAMFGNSKFRFFYYPLIILLLIESHYLGFLIGIIIADAYLYFIDLGFNKAFQLIFFLSSILISLFLIKYNLIFIKYMNLYLFNYFFALIVTLNVLIIKPISSIFKSKPFVVLGKASFGVYLIHTILIWSLGTYAFYLLNINGFDYMQIFLILNLLITSLSIFLGFYFDKYIDKNILLSIGWGANKLKNALL